MNSAGEKKQTIDPVDVIILNSPVFKKNFVEEIQDHAMVYWVFRLP